MQRLTSPLLSLLLLTAVASPALAQADARAAYEQAKQAYQAGNYAQARDLAETASQTDRNNPEVFLLLGKAQYQLAEVDTAITAWKRTLSLAPEQPYATRMLAALRGQQSDIETRIKLVRVMLDEKLVAEALMETTSLLTDKRVSESQRAAILLLQAESTLKLGRSAETLAKIQHLRVLYAKQLDPVRAALIEGRAKLQSGGEATLEGIAMLRKLVADNPDTPAAATARYALIADELKQGANPARARALAKWLAECPDHPQVGEALRALIEAYLRVAGQEAKPTPKSELNKWDVDALALADELYKRLPRAAEARELTELLLRHLDQRYAGNGAYMAAITGIEPRGQLTLPRESRRLILDALLRYKTAIAVKELQDQQLSGELPEAAMSGTMPKTLSDVLAIFGTINVEFPDKPAWATQAGLAATVRGYAAKVRMPAKTVLFRGPDAWAIDIARPVIKANADAAAVKSAVDLMRAIIADYTGCKNVETRKLRLQTSRLLTAMLDRDHASWPAVMAAHAGQLDAYAQYEFEERLKRGEAVANAQLSVVQQELLDTLGKLVAEETARAPAALQQISKHLQPWIAHEHWALVEKVYAASAKFLPRQEQRLAELAVVNVWLQRVARGHQRLTAAGFTVPRKLDELHRRALVRCYQLQAELPAESPEVNEFRRITDSIIAHYEGLEYFDVAEAVVAVGGEKPVDLADEYAQLRAAELMQKHAGRELARVLKQYGSADHIALTPEFKIAIVAYTKFIADRPQSTLIPRASAAIFGIGKLFQQHGAHRVAAEVYGDFAKFAADIDGLSTATPGQSSTAELATLARADALLENAKLTLSKQMSEQATDTPPPAELSKEFAESIAACKLFIKTYEKSPQVGAVIERIMQVGRKYASIDAWDVADSVYAELLASEGRLHRPERLEFCRGLCQLGRAMPDHAKAVLSALSAGGMGGGTDGDEGGGIQLATLPASDRGGRVATPSDTPPPAGSQPIVSNGNVPRGGARSSLIPQPRPGAKPSAETQRDVRLLAMIRQRESNRATQIAQLRSNVSNNYHVAQGAGQAEQMDQQVQQARQVAATAPALSVAELARQEKALLAAYDIFQGIRKDHSQTPTAEQARAEILVMVGHWRTLTQWEKAIAIASQFLADNAKDRELPKLRLEIARDRLALAAKSIEGKVSKQERLNEVVNRFDAARADLARIVKDFPKERSYQQQAQWDIANSFLSQARVVAAFSPTLARGQYVRTTRELRRVARQYPKHPQIGTIPQMLWSISTELEGRGYYEEAILVWNDLSINNPAHAVAQQAAMKVAQTYQTRLKRPLRAVEAYQELNFARGGNDQSLQDAIFQIGATLKNEKRWVEALHILSNFVDSFPRHPQAGQALTMVGQIHQANEAWEDAISAYHRVIGEFNNAQFVQEAKWSIAECTINLSRWDEAMTAYRNFVAAYPGDSKVAEANRRIEVLKDLARYQVLVDEEGQRKAFDAQHQIAAIVHTQLANPVKAIIEYRKVVEKWPKSHLADDALYAVGTTYLSLGETEKAREALLRMADKYAASPLADDALFMVGKSFEDEAQRLASDTRAKSMERNKEVAQRRAYQNVQSRSRRQEKVMLGRINTLKKAGKTDLAGAEEANWAGNRGQFNDANVRLFAQNAWQEVQSLTATQLADRQDKINAALRQAIEAYTSASKVAGADKADDALLKIATIQDQQLKDAKAAMDTWLEIVRQFSGTAVAEDASWRIAQYHERNNKYKEAIEAYKSFLRSYRSSPKAGPAQFAIAENYEHLGEWVNAMDSYTNYLNNFPQGPHVAKAKEQINWIKTYRL